MAESAELFVEQFQEMWRAPTPEGFAALFQEDGHFKHPEMPQPLPASAAQGYMQAVLEVIPDLSLRLRHAAHTDDVVMLEWTQSGTVAGQAINWDGADRFTLHDGLAVEGVAYFDPRPVLAALEIDPGEALSQLGSSVNA